RTRGSTLASGASAAMREAASFVRASSLDATMTCAPCLASSRAISKPIPALAPVTIATRPRRSGMSPAVHGMTFSRLDALREHLHRHAAEHGGGSDGGHEANQSARHHGRSAGDERVERFGYALLDRDRLHRRSFDAELLEHRRVGGARNENGDRHAVLSELEVKGLPEAVHERLRGAG